MTTLDTELVDALRAGDERVFADLVDRYSPAMLALACRYVSGREVAEDVVQDTWIALLKGIDGFEGRSSLRTWLFRVLINIAKTRGVRDKRTAPFDVSAEDGSPTVHPQRFRPATTAGRGTGSTSRRRGSTRRSAISSRPKRSPSYRRNLRRLPEQQALVVALRDVEGYDLERGVRSSRTDGRESTGVCCIAGGRGSGKRWPGTSRRLHDEPLGRSRLRRADLPGVRRTRHRYLDDAMGPARGRGSRTSGRMPGLRRLSRSDPRDATYARPDGPGHVSADARDQLLSTSVPGDPAASGGRTGLRDRHAITPVRSAGRPGPRADRRKRWPRRSPTTSFRAPPDLGRGDEERQRRRLEQADGGSPGAHDRSCRRPVRRHAAHDQQKHEEHRYPHEGARSASAR